MPSQPPDVLARSLMICQSGRLSPVGGHEPRRRWITALAVGEGAVVLSGQRRRKHHIGATSPCP